LDDPLYDFVDIRENVAGWAAKHATSSRLQVGVAPLVADNPVVAGMISAIDLDHQLCCRAVEIGDVRSDRVLAAKRRSFATQHAKPRPEQHLGRRHVAS
jgi:hypothetical protein